MIIARKVIRRRYWKHFALQTTHQREIERVKTGILHLDELIEGGSQKANSVLLAGYAGTGKTIFCTEFINHGAVEYNEKGVYAVL